MKIFLFLFFITIISNNQKNESIEIIKCVLSNEKLKNDLNSLKFQIEKLIKEGDYSNLISLLKIFSMVEEVKSCFKNPSQSINNEEIVLKGYELFDCIQNNINNDEENSVFNVQHCWNSLSIEEKAILISKGADAVDSICRDVFAESQYKESICHFIVIIIHSFE